MAPSEYRGRPKRADWLPKHFHTVCLGGTHPYHALGPLNGPLLHSRGPKRARFGPKKPLLGVLEVLGGPPGARFGPNGRQLVRLGWNHGRHTLWPGIGPLLGPQGLQKGSLWPKNCDTTDFGTKQRTLNYLLTKAEIQVKFMLVVMFW